MNGIVVESNDKQRFSISDDGLSIRANQGHSIDVNLYILFQEPPIERTYSTAARFVNVIMAAGLNKMKRPHVYLTESQAVAYSLGSRYGNPVILMIAAKKMYKGGFKFYKSAKMFAWLIVFQQGT